MVTLVMRSPQYRSRENKDYEYLQFKHTKASFWAPFEQEENKMVFFWSQALFRLIKIANWLIDDSNNTLKAFLYLDFDLFPYTETRGLL